MAETNELLRKVLEFQTKVWKQGNLIPVEEFLTLWPELKADPSAVCRLAANEYCLRCERGYAPHKLEAFIARFPEHAAALTDLLTLETVGLSVFQVSLHDSEAISDSTWPNVFRAHAAALRRRMGTTESTDESGEGNSQPQNWLLTLAFSPPHVPGYQIKKRLGVANRGTSISGSRTARIERWPSR